MFTKPNQVLYFPKPYQKLPLHGPISHCQGCHSIAYVDIEEPGTSSSMMDCPAPQHHCCDPIPKFALNNVHRIWQLLVQVLVISHLDYCNSLLAGLPTSVTKPLERAAVCLVYSLAKYSQVTSLLCDFHWLPVAARIQFKIMVLAVKAVNGTAPVKPSTLFYYISWPTGTAIAESKQNPLSEVTTPLCFGTSMVERTPNLVRTVE